AYVTLTASQKTARQTQSSFVSSDFTRKLLNLKNVSPAEYTMTYVMDTTAQKTSSTVITTTPLPPPLVIPPTLQATPAPTIPAQTTYVSVLPDFAFMF
ncbi:hypothetical protein Tco_0135914, partial [Tanacetum coccineum]